MTPVMGKLPNLDSGAGLFAAVAGLVGKKKGNAVSDNSLLERVAAVAEDCHLTSEFAFGQIVGLTSRKGILRTIRGAPSPLSVRRVRAYLSKTLCTKCKQLLRSRVRRWVKGRAEICDFVASRLSLLLTLTLKRT